MIYRYRLKDCKENEGLNSRQIEGTTIYKKRWLHRKEPLVIDTYLNLVEFEKYHNEEDIQQKEQKDKEERVRIQREYGKQRIEGLKDKAEAMSDEKSRDNKIERSMTIYDMKKEDLIIYAHERGFLESETDGLKKQELINLLELEAEVG